MLVSQVTTKAAPSITSQPELVTTNSLPTTLESTTSNLECTCSAINTNTCTQATLVATIGVLAVLLIVAIIGWERTCVILKKKRV